MKLEVEIWKDIDGYEGYYQVSTLGNVKSLKRIVETPNFKRKINFRMLKFSKRSGGYYTVKLHKNGEKNVQNIHQLVAKTFISNKLEKPCVNHKDGNKLNNCVSNLEWVTHKENTRHAHDTGIITPIKWEEHASSKLKNKDVLDIRKRRKDNEQIKSVYETYQNIIAFSTLKDVWYGTTWKGLSDE